MACCFTVPLQFNRICSRDLYAPGVDSEQQALENRSASLQLERFDCKPEACAILRERAACSDGAGDPLYLFQPRVHEMPGGGAGFEKYGVGRVLRCAAIERGLGLVFDRELDLLRGLLAPQESDEAQCAIQSRSDACRADEFSIDHDTLIDGDGAEFFQEMMGSPVGGPYAAFQQIRRAAKQRAGANGENVFRLSRAIADKSDRFPILHHAELAGSTGHDEDIERGRLAERDLRGEQQTVLVADGIQIAGDDMESGIWHAAEDLEGAGEIDLVHVRKNDRSDVKMIIMGNADGEGARGHGVNVVHAWGYSKERRFRRLRRTKMTFTHSLQISVWAHTRTLHGECLLHSKEGTISHEKSMHDSR